MATTTTTTGKTLIADICLYGTSQVGAGYLVMTKEGHLFGRSEPNPRTTFTEAVFLALDEIVHRAAADGYEARQAVMDLGVVRVFHPGGEQFSDIELGKAWPYYGDLARHPVTADMMHVVTVQEIQQAQAARREARGL